MVTIELNRLGNMKIELIAKEEKSQTHNMICIILKNSQGHQKYFYTFNLNLSD